jgi:hypothetical protein
MGTTGDAGPSVSGKGVAPTGKQPSGLHQRASITEGPVYFLYSVPSLLVRGMLLDPEVTLRQESTKVGRSVHARK